MINQIKKYIPLTVKKRIKPFFKVYINFLYKFIPNKRQKKIFCISFQRTGTTSVGQFFNDHNFRVATWRVSRRNNWTLKWFSGDYEGIFNSMDFKFYQVFEDDPWWGPGFYKYLYHRFPNSLFILMERDPDKWFNSMMAHSNGKTLGNTHRHAHIYNRENEFYQLKNFSNIYNREFDSLLDLDISYRDHYTNIYKLRNYQVKEFFRKFDESRLLNCRLEDSNKWIKLASFIGIHIDPTYDVHVNKTIK